MAIIFRHGGEAHTVRPDRVYRTSVLSPIVGYQPGADVQAIATAFTQGPPRAGSLAGLNGPFSQFGARIKAWWNARRAHKFMMNGAGGAPMAPAFREAQDITPQLAHQMQMLARLAPREGGGPMPAAYAMATRRINTYYRAG